MALLCTQWGGNCRIAKIRFHAHCICLILNWISFVWNGNIWSCVSIISSCEALYTIGFSIWTTAPKPGWGSNKGLQAWTAAASSHLKHCWLTHAYIPMTQHFLHRWRDVWTSKKVTQKKCSWQSLLLSGSSGRAPQDDWFALSKLFWTWLATANLELGVYSAANIYSGLIKNMVAANIYSGLIKNMVGEQGARNQQQPAWATKQGTSSMIHNEL